MRNARKDLDYPCPCPDRFPGCRESCQKPEYVKAKEMNDRLKEDRKERMVVYDYDFHAIQRRCGYEKGK